MPPPLLLYWLTESSCDLGTPIDADRLDPAIRERVLALAGRSEDEDSGPLALRLPFLDRREARHSSEVLSGLEFVREDNVIRSLPPTPWSALRDHAATLVAQHPAWRAAAAARNGRFFRTWQKVSVTLQAELRQRIPEMYFDDVERLQNREAAYPLLVYAASRVCRGRPRTEFTYDVADEETLARATHLIGRSLQEVLRGVESRLHAAGRHELARRYAPVWHQDVLRAVHRKPRELISLLADEAVLINAVIDLGTARRIQAVNPYARATLGTLRKVCGEDMRELAPGILNTATSALGMQTWVDGAKPSAGILNPEVLTS